MSGMKLYEYTDQMKTLARNLDEIGATPEDLQAAHDAYLNDASVPLCEKLDGYVALIKEEEALAGSRATEAKRLAASAKAAESRAENLKERLEYFFTVNNIDKYRTRHFDLSMEMDGGNPAVIAEDTAKLPLKFRVRTVVITADKKALLAAIKAGQKVRGASLAAKKLGLRIR